MGSNLPFFPEQASTQAAGVDALYLFLCALSVFFSLLIAGLVVFFAVRYHRKSESERPAHVHEPLALELAWTLIPLAIVVVIFVWSAQLYVAMNRPPRDAMQIDVVGKRWMWKVQHMTGQREINELHVPLGVPVKLNLISEDVIHSFFVPAFRMKKDALPGRYTTAWFQATRPGRYHLFCAEYCGTKHSGMIGSVVVMEPAQFQAWLGGGVAGASLASA
jgi:cytochrome c oxidase subunit 2